MTEDSLLSIFINASLVNNFVLAYFLGLCPFLGVSGKLSTATRMGGAVIFVMLVSSICGYGVQYALVALDAPYLRPSRMAKERLGGSMGAGVRSREVRDRRIP